MTNAELIEILQQKTVNIYNQFDLKCLRGLDDLHLLNGKQILSWHSQTIRACEKKHKGHFNYYKNLDDILFCSDELLYFTAKLFLYRPFINNPLEEAIHIFDRIEYPNYQNLAAKRYSMFADVVSQTAYNYWDRIGDLLASFFPEKIDSNQVYFGKSLDLIPEELHQSSNYAWLVEFKNNEYRNLNTKRKEIVHYNSTDINYKHQQMSISNDKEKMEMLQRDRELLADFYKAHILTTLIGFEKTLLLLEEINNLLFIESDIDIPSN